MCAAMMNRSLRAASRLAGRRGYVQTLAEPTAWNQAPVVVTTLPNGIRVASKETFGEVASVGVYPAHLAAVQRIAMGVRNAGVH